MRASGLTNTPSNLLLSGAAATCTIVASVCAPPPASAETKATFITGTWATKDGCQKLVDIAAGGNRNVETVPEVLTADGFDGWEGSCTFKEIKEMSPGKVYDATLACGEGPEEWEENDTFVLTGGTITVTVDDEATVFVRCDAATKDKKQ